VIPLAFLSPGIGEMLIIAVAALLVFGGHLPDVMRNLGRTYAKFRHGMNEVTHPLRQEMRRIDLEAASGAVPTISRRPAVLEAPKDVDEGDDPAVADRDSDRDHGTDHGLPGPGPTDTGAGSLASDEGPPRPVAPPPSEAGVADEPPPV